MNRMIFKHEIGLLTARFDDYALKSSIKINDMDLWTMTALPENADMTVIKSFMKAAELKLIQDVIKILENGPGDYINLP